MPLIVLEGIDKAGKDAQSKFLGRELTKRGCQVELIAFPDYATHLGKELKKFLEGKINLRSEVRQLLYVANRWERQRDVERWLKEEVFVIADRYVPSGIAYGLANGLDLNWMLSLEKGLPAAEMVIVIDISTETSYKRDASRDFYEKNRVFLRKVRGSYFELAKRFGWDVVDGEMVKGDVAQEILKRVTCHFNI